MALIKCKECLNQVSDKADSCPHCGTKVSKKLGCFTIAGYLTVGFLVMLYYNGESNKVNKLADDPNLKLNSDVIEPQRSERPKNVPIEVSSIDLSKEYEQNEAKADSMFKNKTLYVTGVVVDITKDLFDNTRVMLNSRNQFLHVNALIVKENEQNAIELVKGSKIKLRCTGNGAIIKAPMLNDCEFLE